MAGGLDTTGLDTTRRTAAERVTDRLRAIPVEGGLGTRVSRLDADGGQLRLPIPPGPDGDPDGVALTVALNVLADVAGGVAVSMCAGRGLGSPTIELRIDHLAPPAPDAGWLIADSTVPHHAAGAGYAAVVVHDDRDRAVAHAHGHFAVTTPETALGEPPPMDRTTDGTDGIAPHRPDALLATLAAVVTPSGPGDDPADWSLTCGPELSNPRGQVQGGVAMAIGQLAQRRAQAPDLSDGAELRPLTVHAEYLRPAPIDGTELRCRTEYVRRGRRFRTLRTELVRADGRVATIVTGLWAAAS
ncbi:PaaI family thioesterase [Pseudonocardia acaciae]|uniref:PaaI family thioesterase n=1 Tax=Pseudonocardia acaciae TaxID=551276 RepID=UPI00048FC0BA|nr:PaaI family thioesterase [Pseudonocardia acaciae]